MAAAVERMLLAAGVAPARLTGLVSVPAGCGMPLERIEVRETRPAGLNVPTPAAAAATREMLALCADLAAADGGVAAIFHSPHFVDEGCDCRKPKPGMLGVLPFVRAGHGEDLPTIVDRLLAGGDGQRSCQRT
jgi:hypothetical protein